MLFRSTSNRAAFRAGSGIGEIKGGGAGQTGQTGHTAGEGVSAGAGHTPGPTAADASELGGGDAVGGIVQDAIARSAITVTQRTSAFKVPARSRASVRPRVIPSRLSRIIVHTFNCSRDHSHRLSRCNPAPGSSSSNRFWPWAWPSSSSGGRCPGSVNAARRRPSRWTNETPPPPSRKAPSRRLEQGARSCRLITSPCVAASAAPAARTV